MRPDVSVRPASPGRVEVHTRCPHGDYRMPYELGGRATERLVVGLAIGLHHALSGCGCMRTLWPFLRAPGAPVDLDLVRARLRDAWAQIEGERRGPP